MDMHRIFKLGGGVYHVTRDVRPLSRVKKSKIKDTRSRYASAAKKEATDGRINCKLDRDIHRWSETYDTLSMSVGQIDRK